MKSYFKPISILTSGKLHSKPINPLKISQKAQFLRFTTSTKEIQLNQIESSEQKEKFLEIKWKDSHISKFHNLWLRDNCSCNQCKSNSGQKLVSAADIFPYFPNKHSVETKDSRAILKLEWNDNHISEYPLDWLRKNCYSNLDANKDKHNLTTIPPFWNGSRLKSLPEINYKEIISDEKGYWKWIEQLYYYGISLIKNAPVGKNTLEQLIEKHCKSYIRPTMYGKIFDVISIPKPNNIAYSSLPIGYHSDLNYYEAPPGLQFLHCLKSDAIGGVNHFVDGFLIAEILKRRKPDEFKLLSEVKMTYHKEGNDHWMYYRRPIIDVNENNKVIAIHYSPPFEGPLSIPFDLVERYYEAYRSFVSLSRLQEVSISYRLEPGDIASFNNRRILHARGAFDPSSGKRHLRGTYMDLDEFLSIYRRLSVKYPPNIN